MVNHETLRPNLTTFPPANTCHEIQPSTPSPLKTNTITRMSCELMPLTEVLSEIETAVLQGKLSGHVSEGPCSLSSLRELEKHIERLDLFSKNEHVDDLDVLTLRCLNLPYYLALACDGQRGERKSLLQHKKMALVYYDRFLQRCVEYDVLEPRIKRMVENCLEEEEADAREDSTRVGGSMPREEKIEMFKIEKQLQRDMDMFQRMSEDEDGARPLVLMMVNRYGVKAVGARQMVRQEVAMLDAAENMGASEREAHSKMMSKKREETAMLMGTLRDALGGLENKRETLRKGVFRPSHILPTYTVEEFGEMEMERMRAEEAGRLNQDVSKNSDESDEEDVEKSRAWDDFKDDNPRGWGNSKLRPTR